MKVALYARVSKALEQHPENQLIELRRWAAAAGHEVIGEYVDEICGILLGRGCHNGDDDKERGGR